MSLDPDVLVDRVILKRRLRKWQLFAILALLLSSLALLPTGKARNEYSVSVKPKTDYIGRISIENEIMDDPYRDKVLSDLLEDNHLKALVVSIDSPGGTTAGSESLYYQIRDISASGKPVVVVMKTLAASGGYMTALAGDYIIARKGTITGSIGVLVQSFEITKLAEKLGIKFNTLKTSELKASPSPFEELTPKSAEAIQSLLQDFYDFFVDTVAERRKMPREKAAMLADGRIYSGNQAVKNGLIDAIGGEKEALEWLRKEKKISKTLEVEDVSVIKPEQNLRDMLLGDKSKTKILDKFLSEGFLAVWRP